MLGIYKWQPGYAGRRVVGYAQLGTCSGFLKSTGTCWTLVAYDERRADRNEAKRWGEGFYVTV